ncbi:MAG: DUF6494 family protein, partial [Acetobacteraceae bacterium]
RNSGSAFDRSDQPTAKIPGAKGPWLVVDVSVHSRFGVAKGAAHMDQDKFNMAIRKFLKVVGVTSQREIEDAVAKALQNGRLHGDETLSAKMTLEIGALDLKHEVNGKIEVS